MGRQAGAPAVTPLGHNAPMPNRDSILHNVQRWEELLSLGDPLLEFPPEATAADPLTIYVARELLERVLEDNIAAIHANRDAVDTTPELVADTVQMLRRRERFLAWVRRFPNPNVYLALYPASESEIVKDDGEGPDPDEPEGGG